MKTGNPFIGLPRPEGHAKNVEKLNNHERALLIQLINIVEASEWSSGDYNFTQNQFNILQRAKLKLEQK